MKTKILLTVMNLIFAVVQINAQAHDNSKGGCRLAKNHIDTGYVCPACAAVDKKEADARKVEDKKRSDAVLAKSKVDEAAKQAAFKKQQAEMAEKNKVTQLKVVMPKISESTAKKTSKVEMDNVEKFRFENEYDKSKNIPTKFYNSKIYYEDKLVFESNQFTKIDKVLSFPNNKIVFVAIYPTECGDSIYPNHNNKILLDENFKEINIEGINKYWQLGEREGVFYLSTLPEICEKTRSTDGGYWEYSAKYVLDPETMKLSDKSQSLSAIMCNCDK